MKIAEHPHESRRRDSFADILILAIATGLGVGFVPWAPGTFGGLWGLVLVAGMQGGIGGQSLSGWSWGLTSLAVILLGVPICAAAANGLGRKDPGCVVYDEIAAFPIVFAGVALTPLTGLLGFALFRLFDIAKPWPCRRLERLPGGWGIMADDLMAGVYAGAVLWVAARWVIPRVILA